MGVHRDVLGESLMLADRTLVYQPENLSWDLTDVQNQAENIQICTSIDEIIAQLQQEVDSNCHFLLMSNGGFGGIYQRLKTELSGTL